MWTRVTVLVALRGAAILTLAALLAKERESLAIWGAAVWALVRSVPLLGAVLAPFDRPALALPGLVGVGLVALVYWAAYQLLPLQLWSRWHGRARRDSVRYLVQGSMTGAPRNTIPPGIWAALGTWIALLLASLVFLPAIFARLLTAS